MAFKPGGSASAAIAWRDSAEAAAESVEGPADFARCHFATGFLRGLLSRMAGRAVEVAEVRCGGGTEPCWFLFGSSGTIRRVKAGNAADAGSREH